MKYQVLFFLKNNEKVVMMSSAAVTDGHFMGQYTNNKNISVKIYSHDSEH